MFDILASEVQYAQHLAPVWLATRPRGTFWTTSEQMVRYLGTLGVQAYVLKGTLDRPTLTSSIIDYAKARRRKAPALAYMEHGCGQSYAGDRRTARTGAYAGGDGREGCSLILAPNAIAAARWSERYPGTPLAVIGATRVLTPPEDAGRPLLVVSFHWDGGSIPEMRSALHHYVGDLARLKRHIPLAVHAHPRAANGVRAIVRRMSLEFIDDIAEVARRATVYAVDNSSSLWELGRTRPVIALNDPRYRRDVDHGLRFWSHVPLQVDDSDGLLGLAERLLFDGESDAERDVRERLVGEVIPSLDGAHRAATLVAEWSRQRSP